MKTKLRRSVRPGADAILLASCWLLLVALPAGAQEGDDAWPREIVTEAATIIVYQPQLESFEGNLLSSRAAVSVEETGDEAVFGAVWLVATVEVDREDRMVYVQNIRVPRVRFPDATVAQEAALSSLLERELPKSDMSISLDRVITGLQRVEQRDQAAAELSTDPPEILIRTTPTALVLIDGDPELGEIPDTKLMRVMNSTFLIAFDGKARTYYLYAGPDAWYTARQIKGEWSFTSSVPATIAALAPDPADEKADEPEIEPEDEVEETGPPEIVVATVPTELINIEGDPVFTPAAEDALMFVSNADGTLIREMSSRDFFVLLSGRWYRSASFDGPWQFVASDALPDAFASISPDSDLGDTRAFIAGTEEAQDAILDAQIPETAVVSRSEASLEVQYDGAPELEAVEGTSLSYVKNASESVLKSGTKYYACSDGVWFVANSANGPWEVATERPPELDSIPPSSPVYNVKYVYIYDVTPTVVHVGYTAGYAGGYVFGPTIVYGTGFWYRPWWRTIFFARPVTFGFGVHWNPWAGWRFGFGFRGFSFGIGVGFWSPWRAAWWGPVGFRGYRAGFRRGFYRGHARGFARGSRAGFRAGYRAGARSGHRHGSAYGNRRGVTPANRNNRRDVADRGGRDRAGGRDAAGARDRAGTRDQAGNRDAAGNRDRAGTRDQAGNREAAGNRDRAGTRDQAGNRDAAGSRDRAGTREQAGGQEGARDRAGGGDRAGNSGSRQNNVFADKDGNVHRRGSDGSWENVSGGDRGGRTGDRAATDRSNANRAGADRSNANRAGADRSSASRQTGSQNRATSQNRGGSSGLERDHQSRSRGSANTQRNRSSSQRSSSAHRSGGSRGGGSRGGGGRGGGGGRR